MQQARKSRRDEVGRRRLAPIHNVGVNMSRINRRTRPRAPCRPSPARPGRRHRGGGGLDRLRRLLLGDQRHVLCEQQQLRPHAGRRTGVALRRRRRLDAPRRARHRRRILRLQRHRLHARSPARRERVPQATASSSAPDNPRKLYAAVGGAACAVEPQNRAWREWVPRPRQGGLVRGKRRVRPDGDTGLCARSAFGLQSAFSSESTTCTLGGRR